MLAPPIATFDVPFLLERFGKNEIDLSDLREAKTKGDSTFQASTKLT